MRLGLELGYSMYDVDELTVTPLRLGVFGQYVLPSGFGGYTQFNLSFVRYDDDTSGQNTGVGLSNLELGAIFAVEEGALEAIGRMGIALPTASQDTESILANSFNAFSRMTDSSLAPPGSTTLRASLSPIVRSGNLLVRADLGFDLPASSPDGVELNALVRFNLGVGLLRGDHQFGVELVNLLSLDSDDSEQLVHNVGLSYRGALGTLSPFFGVFKPLGFEDSSELLFTLIGGFGIDFDS